MGESWEAKTHWKINSPKCQHKCPEDKKDFFQEIILYLFILQWFKILLNLTMIRMLETCWWIKVQHCVWWTADILEFKLFFHFCFHVLGWGENAIFISCVLQWEKNSHVLWPCISNIIGFKNIIRNPVSNNYKKVTMIFFSRFLHHWLTIMLQVFLHWTSLVLKLG